MLIQFRHGKTLYLQVFEALRQAILEGELKAGSKLPSSRKQALDLGVSRNIILLAYEQLIAEGYLETRQGAGTFVSRDLPDKPLPKRQSMRPVKQPAIALTSYAKHALTLKAGSLQALDSPSNYNFRYGLIPPDSKLLSTWKYCQNKVGQVSLNYDQSAGYLALREALVPYLRQHRGVVCHKDQILITSGSQQALYLISQALLEKGSNVLIEEPHYQGARQIFLAQQAQLLPSAVDEEGMRIPKLSAQLAYVTPSHQFPLGSVMSLSRRLELLQWAKEQQAYIVEDDYDSEYRYESKPITAIQSLDSEDRVIYIGTFSKTLFPALRLGFLVLPEHLLEVIKTIKWLIDRHSSSLDQAALAHFIQEGHFEKHIRRMRNQNAKRRKALLTALDKHFTNQITLSGSNAGIHVVVWFRQLADSQADDVLREAQKQDVSVYPISAYYLQPPKNLGLLFGYASLDEAAIDEGIRRFAKAMKAFILD